MVLQILLALVLLYYCWPLLGLFLVFRAILYINSHPDFLSHLSTGLDIAAGTLILLVLAFYLIKFLRRLDNKQRWIDDAIIKSKEYVNRATKIRAKFERRQYQSDEDAKKTVGLAGELDVLRTLEHIKNIIVYWSVGINSKNKKTEIDILVVSPYGLLQIEVKRYAGEYVVDESGDFRKFSEHEGGDKIIHSPFEQIRRANGLLKETLLHYLDEPIQIIPLVVFTNPSFRIQGLKENEICHCTLDAAPNFFENFAKGAMRPSPLDPHTLAKIVASLDHGNVVPAFYDSRFQRPEQERAHAARTTIASRDRFGDGLYVLARRMGMDNPCAPLEGTTPLFCDSRTTNPTPSSEEERDLRDNPPYRLLPQAMLRTHERSPRRTGRPIWLGTRKKRVVVIVLALCSMVYFGLDHDSPTNKTASKERSSVSTPPAFALVNQTPMHGSGSNPSQKERSKLQELDDYATALTHYREEALAARNKAETTWRGVIVSDAGTSIEIRPVSKSSEKYSVRLHLRLVVQNTTPWPVTVPAGHYLWRLTKPSGEILASGSAYANGQGTIQPGKSVTFQEVHSLNGLGDDPLLLQWVGRKLCYLSVYPKELKIRNSKYSGYIKPDGSPFPIPRPPQMPDWATKANDKYSADQMKEKFQRAVEKQIEINGGPPPLPDVNISTLSSPREWFTPRVITN